MTPLETLKLPAPVLNALLKAGLRHVEDICALTAKEVAFIDGIHPSLERVREIRAALSKLGLDVRGVNEDPVGWPNFPSRKALRNLFDSLDFMPVTRKAFTLYLLTTINHRELLARVAPEDEGKIIRLLDLIDECQDR